MDSSRLPRARFAPPRVKGAWLALGGLATLACIYHAEDRCGPHMRLSDVEACVCGEGFVQQGTVCVPCGEHETEKHGACVCDENYQRLTDAAACTAVPMSGLGADCALAPCSDPTFSYCVLASNGDRYCSSRGCQTSADCPETYACSTDTAGAKFCRRSPLGMTAPCSTDNDCAGNEATFCETLFSHSCLVQGCSLSMNDCFDGWECCDASGYGMPIPICIPEGMCP